MQTRNEKLRDNTQAETVATEKVASLAITRLRRYEEKLMAEFEACGDVVCDLLAYANTGKLSDVPERVARAQAIKTVLAAIPRAIASLEDERNAAVRLRNDTVSSTRAAAAKKAYKEGLKEFEANYSELAHSRDKSALRLAVNELARLAREAGMLSDLRHCFRRSAWRGRYRADELARI